MGRTQRLDGLDLARGVAVLSMLVAHLSPVGGPANITEYLTLPFFSFIIGVSAALWLRTQPARPTVLTTALYRGVVLFAVGLVLTRLYDQIVIVLQTLGVLTIVLLPLTYLLAGRWRVALLLAALGALASPVLTDVGRTLLLENPEWYGTWRGDLATILAASPYYRVVSLLPVALAGVAFASIPRDAIVGARAWRLLVALWGFALAIHLAGRFSSLGAEAYSGTTPEVLAAMGLAAGSVVLAFLLVDVARARGLSAWLQPLIDTGRTAFTAYAVQVLTLAAIAALRPPRAADDSWWILGLTAVVVVATSWVLVRAFGTGPLEWVLRLLPRRGKAPAGRVTAPDPAALPR